MYLHVAIYLGFQHSTAGGKGLDPRMLPVKRISYYCYQPCVDALGILAALPASFPGLLTLRFCCILQAIKNWTVGRPGIGTRLLHYYRPDQQLYLYATNISLNTNQSRLYNSTAKMARLIVLLSSYSCECPTGGQYSAECPLPR